MAKPTHKTILVIDDNERLVESYRTFFEEEGYTVFSAGAGNDGLNIARHENPSLVLLDLMLPGMNGLEVLETLKSDPTTQAIPVVVMTALLNDAEKDRSFELGAADYVGKVDIEPKQLLRKVEHTLGNAHDEN